MHPTSCFLTLTYDDVHLPFYGQLVKSDLQKFFKRLRKNVGPFRYVACGEYGERSRRPHFHVALFGLDFVADRIEYGTGIRGDTIFVSPLLTKTWGMGHLQQQIIGSLTFESAAYIARYITKRVSGVGASSLPLACNPDTGEFVMPEPEFLACSKGIGASWFDRFFKTDVFPHGRVITAQGSPAPIPSFYKRKLNAMDKHKLRATVEINVQSALAKKRFEDLPERRAARSSYAKSRTGAFARDLKA